MKKVFNILGLLLLVAVVVWTFIFLWKKSQPKDKIYAIEEVKIANIEKSTIATGKVQPRNEVLIKPQISGIVSELYKQSGDQVKTGDVIAKIKVIPDMLNLSNAENRLKQAEIVAQQNQRTFDRDSELFNQKVISKEEYEQSQLKNNNSQLELNAAKDHLTLVREGISKSSAKYSTTLVRATISGTILDIPVKVGNSVIQSNNFNDGTTIAAIANLNDMQFIGKIDETEIGKLTEGMPMQITIGAMQDKNIQAILEYISPKGMEDAGTVLFEIKAAMKLPQNLFIRAGYSANATIILNNVEQVLSIPETCIEFASDTAFVYIQTNDNPQEFTKQIVKVGLSDGIKIEIKDGLELNQKVRGNEIIEN